MSDRFKFRIWDKESQKYHNGMEVFDYMRGLLSPDKYVMEQCTGLKDKNGKLIYEGDIVEIKVWDDIEEEVVKTKGKVYWSKEDASYLIYISYDAEYSFNSYATFFGKEIKVIGNIHENAGLLEN